MKNINNSTIISLYPYLPNDTILLILGTIKKKHIAQSNWLVISNSLIFLFNKSVIYDLIHSIRNIGYILHNKAHEFRVYGDNNTAFKIHQCGIYYNNVATNMFRQCYNKFLKISLKFRITYMDLSSLLI